MKLGILNLKKCFTLPVVCRPAVHCCRNMRQVHENALYLLSCLLAHGHDIASQRAATGHPKLRLEDLEHFLGGWVVCNPEGDEASREPLNYCLPTLILHKKGKKVVVKYFVTSVCRIYTIVSKMFKLLNEIISNMFN